MTRKIFSWTTLVVLASLLLTSCGSATPQNVQAQGDLALPAQDDADPIAPSRPPGWTEDTHDKSADPDYDVVFPQEKVNRLDIVIDPDYWQAMWDDMTELYGEFGASPSMGPPGGAGRPPQGEGMPSPPGEGQPMGPGMPPQGEGRPPGPGMMSTQNPIWVPATIEFDGNSWTNVGLRFKGNSSLHQSWGGGTMKPPFKLDFDEFEDDYAEIEDQRFYGFKQLTLSSNFSDDSLLREKVVADVFREAGVPSAHTAFYRVYVDYGEGPIYFGLYTMVEVIDDTVIQDQFEDGGGNVYKPDGTGASFAQGAFDERSFDKETNQDEADWSDVVALFDALHSGERTSDPAAWRSKLESVFDVDGFLRWLAVNTVVQNWDTYGLMTHNYYLYHDPTTGLLTWIPWDNNMALRDDIGRQGALSLDLSDVNERWPLIRYLVDDEVYGETYTSYVEQTINGAFEPSNVTATYQALHDLIQPYVTGDEGEIEGHTFLNSPEDFDAALDRLIEHVDERYAAASDFVLSAGDAQP